MPKQKTLALSIIIPVFNEENYLKACLDSIANQSVMPDEVIVVDNNSTDNSAAIAKSYPFVSLISEKRQHQSFAQKKGFARAHGDILGRIDADSVLPEDWVATVKNHFELNQECAALSGSAIPYDMDMTRTNKFVFETYFSLARLIAGHKLLWGANCAFRKSAYIKIASKLSANSNIWEDFDLSFCLSKIGRIDYLESIDILASFRVVHKPLMYQLGYQYRAVRTFSLHKNRAVTSFFFISWLSLLIVYPLVIFDRYIVQPINRMTPGYQSATFALGRTPKSDTTSSSRQ